MMMKRLHVFEMIITGLILTGCGLVAPRPTPAPIFVTATPLPPQTTPTPADTAVIGPTAAETPTSPLPTLPTATNTPLPSQQPTFTPTFTPTYTETPVPSQQNVAAKCTVVADGGFAAILTQDTTLTTALGCPVAGAAAINSAVQPFDSGRMLWASQLGDVPTKVIYVLYNNSTYQRYTDTWADGTDPVTTGETAPAGKLTPIRGFGKVWHANPAVKNTLGWATANEAGTTGQLQRFEHGEMLYVLSLQQTFIFAGGTWRANATPF